MTSTSLERPALRRALGLPLLTLYGLGVTVGAGIYVLVGATAAEAGTFAPVAFLIAALVVAFSAFSYAELATRFPVSAGEAAYVQAGFGAAWMAGTTGLLVALSGVVSAAAVSIGAASYLAQMTGLPQPLLVVAVVVAMGLIAIWGITQSVALAGAITVIEVAGLCAVIGWGLGTGPGTGLAAADLMPPLLPGAHWAGIAAASLLAFFAFVGFEDMANVAEEVKDPRHTMPRAILWTLVLATLLYVATTVAVLRAVPLPMLTTSAAPLALVFADAPLALREGFSVVAVVATVNGVLIQMIMASRVIYGLADRGHLPAPLGWVWARTRTPVVATGVVVAAILVLALALPIGALAVHTSQIVLVVFVLVNLALIRLKLLEGRVGRTAAPAHFAVRWWVPVLGAITSTGLLAAGFF